MRSAEISPRRGSSISLCIPSTSATSFKSVPPPLHLTYTATTPSTSLNLHADPLHFTRQPPPLHLTYTATTPSTSLNLHTDSLHFTRQPPPLLLIYTRTPSTTPLQILADPVEFWHYSPPILRRPVVHTVAWRKMAHARRRSCASQ